MTCITVCNPSDSFSHGGIVNATTIYNSTQNRASSFGCCFCPQCWNQSNLGARIHTGLHVDGKQLPDRLCCGTKCSRTLPCLRTKSRPGRFFWNRKPVSYRRSRRRGPCTESGGPNPETRWNALARNQSSSSTDNS